MAEQYKITPIPDRMVSHRIAKKWHLTAQMKDEEIQKLEAEIKMINKQLHRWKKLCVGLIFLTILLSISVIVLAI